MILEPIIDPTFSDNSYGFRPGYSPQQFVEAAQKIVQSGKKYVVDIDLAKFFDQVNHDRLIYLLAGHVPDKRILRIIGITLRSCDDKRNDDAHRRRNGSGQPLESSVE